jgi:hypothetical protein
VTDDLEEPTRRDSRYQLWAIIGLFAASAACVGEALAVSHQSLPYGILAVAFLIVGLILTFRYRRQRSR